MIRKNETRTRMLGSSRPTRAKRLRNEKRKEINLICILPLDNLSKTKEKGGNEKKGKCTKNGEHR